MSAGPQTAPPRDAGLAHPPPVALIFAVTVTGILNNALVGPAIPEILEDFGQPDSSAGLLVAAGSLPGIVLAPIIGVLADRFGRRAVLVPCLLVFTAGGLLSAVAPSFETLAAARVLQGFGSAGLINLAVVLIGDFWQGEQRTTLIGRNAAILTLGLAVAPLVGGGLTDAFGWRICFALYGVALITAFAAWTTLPAHRPDGSVTVAQQLRGAGVALRHPVVLATLGSGVVVFLLIFGLFLAAFPVHLENEFDLGASARGLVIAVPALSSCLVAFNLGRLRARFGLHALLVFAGFTYVAAFAGIAVAPALGLVIVSTIVYGLGEGVFIPSLQDAVAEVSPPEQRGAVFAVWVGAARLGQTLGPLLVALGLRYLSTAGVFAAGAAIAGGLLVFQIVGPVGRTQPTRVEAPVA